MSDPLPGPAFHPEPARPRHAGRFSPAVTVIVAFGVISLLGDAVYESARSANSQYFSLLGVSALQVGLVFGIGEFVGYGLRLLAGVWSDRTGRHWVFMFVGYAMLLAVPAMGLTQQWPALIVLILLERIGKALRNPAKDTVISSVAKQDVGVGFAFGLQEALDQVGAFVGPLVFSVVFWATGRQTIQEYQLGYRIAIVPFVALLGVRVYVWRKVSRAQQIPQMKVQDYRSERLQPLFWVYALFTFVCTLGFVNFAIAGFHIKANGLMSDGAITLLYAVAMGVDALFALLIGHGYDRMKARSGRQAGGLLLMGIIPFATMVLPFLTLADSPANIVAGMMIFGVVLGAHETIMRSAIADITPYHKRGTGYGVFNAIYGLALFGGAFIMGWLYDLGRIGVIRGFTVLLELVAAMLFLVMLRMIRSSSPSDASA